MSTYNINAANVGSIGMPSSPETYFLATDCSGHWYVVPSPREAEWCAWCNLDEDDERAWNAPEWAVRVGGAPSLVRFTGYTIE